MALDEVELVRCIRRPILEDPHFYTEVFRMYRAYKNGNFPEDGGLLSQPARLMILFSVVDGAITYCEEERESREKLKRKRAMR